MKQEYKISMKLFAFIMALLMLLVSLPVSAFASAINTNSNDDASTSINAESETVKKDVIVLEEDEALRDENIKHFKLSDGTTKAVVYSQAVHYKNADGKWVDIDNALTLNGSEYSSNNKQSIKFTNKSGSTGLVSIKDGDYKIDFTPLNTNKVSVVIENPQGSNSRKFEDMSQLNNLVSKAIYADIYDGIDIEYILVGNNIKENIIVKEKQDSYTFSFELKLNKLSAELVNGAIILSDYDSGEQVYEIPVPYMFDANNVHSDSVEYSLVQNNKWKYTFTVTADAEWINADDRVFPVTVDPAVGVIENSIIDITTDSSGDIYLYNENHLLAGDDFRAYVQSTAMPVLPDDAYVIDASISMYHISGSGSYIGVYEALGAWNESSYYGSSLGNSPTDYNYIVPNEDGTYGNNGWFTWDITEIARSWYTDNRIYGVAFKAIEGTSNITFASESFGVNTTPVFSVSYKDMKGTESHWTYVSQSAGLAGNGSVNLATGNLVFEIPTLTTTDSIFSYTPTMIYNSAIAGEGYKYGSVQNGYWYSYVANGFKLNMNETLIKKSYINISGENDIYYVWADSDGTEHYFFKSTKENEENIYYDEDGLQLKLIVDLSDESNNPYCKIVDSVHNERIFYVLGGAPASEGLAVYHLTQLRDSSGNILRFYFDGAHKPNDIKFTPSETTQTTQMFGPLYNTSKKVTMIWRNETKEGILFRHSDTPTGELNPTGGVYLREALYLKCESSVSWRTIVNDFISDTDNVADGIKVNAVVKYEYDENGYLTTAYDTLSGYKVVYTYSNGQVVGVCEYGKNGEEGQSIAIDYYSGFTEVRTSGSDDELGTADDLINVYVFDYQGRVTTTYSTNSSRTEVYGATNGEYENTNANATNNIKIATTTGTVSPNYLLNANFELSHTEPLYWDSITNETGNIYFSPHTQNTTEWRDSKVMLQVNKNGMAAITQDVELAPGDYTLSLNISSYESTNLSIQLKVIDLEDPTKEYIENVATNETFASGSGGFSSLTFKVDGEYNTTKSYRVGIYLYGNENVSLAEDKWEFVNVDEVMLAKATGMQKFSWLNNGSFEQEYEYDTNGLGYWANDYYANIITSNTDTYSSQFHNYLRINGNIAENRESQQILFECTDIAKNNYDNNKGIITGTVTGGEVFTVSGFARATTAMVNDKSIFAIKVEATYYRGKNNDEIVQTEYYPFTTSTNGWQYVTGVFKFKTSELLTKLTISCEYSHNYGFAYFDDISFRPTNEINPEVTEYFYYENGKLKSTKTGKDVTYYGYDSNGNTIDVLSHRQRTKYTYDENHRVTSEEYYKHSSFIGCEEEYDALIKRLKESELQSKVTYKYNQYGQIIEQTVYDPTESSSYITYNTYDNKIDSKIFGALTQTSTSLGETTNFFFDTKTGKLLANIQTDGTGTYYTYDDMGNLIYVQPATYISSKLQKIDNEANVEYVYDINGRLSEILVNGTNYRFYYDDFGNQESVSIGGTTIVSQEINPYNGKVTKATYANGTTVLYDYDDLSRIIKVTYQNVVGEITTEFSYEYEYDSNGNLSKFIDNKTNKTTIYQYDYLNRLIKFIEYDDERLINEYAGSYSYDSEDRLSSVHYAQDYLYTVKDENGNVVGLVNGVLSPHYYYGYNKDDSLTLIWISIETDSDIVVNYTYDNLKRFSTKSTNIGTKNVVEYSYIGASSIVSIYDSSIVKNDIVLNSDVFEYTYDEGYKNITAVSDGTNVLQKYTYDDLNRLIFEENYELKKTFAYTYDKNGNIETEVIKVYKDNALQVLTDTITNNYDYSNTLWTDQLTSYNGGNIQYDAMGNPISYWNGMEFTWQNATNLIELKFDNKNISYTYGKNGTRINKVVDEIVHTYTYDGLKIVSETYDYSTLVYIYDETSSPIGFAYRNASYEQNDFDKYIFTKNLQGDIIGIYSEDGTCVGEYSYDAWGNHTVTNHTNDNIGDINPFRYRGYYFDVESNFYFLNTRYYDPQIKRFISSDVTGTLMDTPMSLTDKNLYAYCDNNPIMRVDNGGEFWETIFDIVSLGMSVVEVVAKPYDPWAWAGLVGDAVDLIPFVTGVGEVTRGLNTARKIADKADDLHDTIKAVDNVADVSKGWKVGDNITDLTKAGKNPSWTTVKSRYWKNEAYYNGNMYDSINLDRMKKGLAPQVELNGKLYSMELHHLNPRRCGGSNAYDNLIKVTPWEHASIDPFRHFVP